RHTRSDRDWSSDVCSSDLLALNGKRQWPRARARPVTRSRDWRPIVTRSKKLRKALPPGSSLSKQTGATCCERRRYRLKFLKVIMIAVVMASALGLGACAQTREAPPPPTAKK